MKILGISGLENAVPFKKSHWANLEPREYRISQGHDAAATLIVDGEVVAAAEEERFTGNKHTGAFPLRAMQSCLSAAGIGAGALDEIAHGFDYAPYREIYNLDPDSRTLFDEVFSREALLREIHRDLNGFPPERVHHVPHHLAHAASAALTSGWEECLVVVNDAMGEVQSLSAYRFAGGRFQPLCELPAADSIGIFYSLVTLHLGFDFNADEYKIMGLAPYGDAARFRPFFEEAVELRPGGGLRIPMLRLNHTRAERETYAATRSHLDRRLIPRRDPAAPIAQDHRDVAAALQECLDRAVLHVCGHFGRSTGLRRLALAGGVALNCTANGRLVDSGLFEDVYVQPASGDDGTALGAALHRASLAGEARNVRMPVPLLGPAYGPERIAAALGQHNGTIRTRDLASLDEACAEAARLIAAGHVLAWYRGRMEFGPRALGNRSILADPGRPEMRDRINAMVKKREAFRPFAPACSEETAHQYFAIPPGTRLPYMITVVEVRPEHRAALPAITHVNGSARLQTVARGDNPDFHALLKAVGRATGKELVLNTSFNVQGQPIVNTPEEAIATFLGTGIEYLFLENHVVSR